MATYYGFLWAITLLNLLRCFVQIGTARGSTHTGLWNALWLVARFGMILLEVSVLVFLLQGYATTGRKALIRTLVVSGGTAALETAIKALYIFALHVPLFLYGGTADDASLDMAWSKWSFWLLRALAAVVVYSAVLALPFTRWRDLLPAKPSFYRYAACLLLLYAAMALGSLLIASKVLGGYCVYGGAVWFYYAAYPPLLYATFLAEFFADDPLDLDTVYYSEMRDAGWLDDDDGGAGGAY